jgi:hypothetical protein
LIRRQRTERPRVGKKLRDVVQVANENIVDDGVGIVEVKAILEVIGVRDANQKKRRAGEN